MQLFLFVCLSFISRSLTLFYTFRLVCISGSILSTKNILKHNMLMQWFNSFIRLVFLKYTWEKFEYYCSGLSICLGKWNGLGRRGRAATTRTWRQGSIFFTVSTGVDSCLPIFFPTLREAAKKVLFLVVRTTKRLGGKGPTTKEKRFFFIIFFLFVAVEKLNIFCLRRHVEIFILVYQRIVFSCRTKNSQYLQISWNICLKIWLF